MSESSHQKLLQVLVPAALRGRLTASPSGKFCIPIPRAKFLEPNEPSTQQQQEHPCTNQAASRVAEGDFPIAPKPTPTARPSEEKNKGSKEVIGDTHMHKNMGQDRTSTLYKRLIFPHSNARVNISHTIIQGVTISFMVMQVVNIFLTRYVVNSNGHH